MTEKRFGIIKTKTYGLYVPVDKMEFYNFSGFESELDCIRVVNALNDLEEKRRENGKIASKFLEENEQLKQSNERIVKDIDLALGFIRHKGYSLQDIKDYEDAKKEYEEDLAYYRNGDVE